MRGWLLTIAGAAGTVRRVLLIALNDELTLGLTGTLRQEFGSGKILARRELSEAETLAAWEKDRCLSSLMLTER